MLSSAVLQRDRLDRHVSRSYLRIGAGAPRARITSMLEESLRLAILPGEEEGRIYCFRCISLPAIPAAASRMAWTSQMQQTLAAAAAQAVHGILPNAGAADAIFFNNLEEALETLLRNALRRDETARATPEWFSASVLGIEAETSYRRQISIILNRLHESSVVPGAAAAILFAALKNTDPAALLSVLPSGTFREWLREFDETRSVAVSVCTQPVQLPMEIKTVLQQAGAEFGWTDPATVWLAAQAVLLFSPGTFTSGTVAKHARATLLHIEREQFSESSSHALPAAGDGNVPLLVFNDEQETDAPRTPVPVRDDTVRKSEGGGGFSNRNENRGEDITGTGGASALENPASVSMAGAKVPANYLAAVRQPMLGERTRAAGLYFLVNALSRLGIASALDACPALAEAGLVNEIFWEIAKKAGVASDDPILACLAPAQTEFAVPAEVLADKSAAIWPQGYAVAGQSYHDSGYLLRLWVVAVKQWCWRTGRIAVRDIVKRDGLVWRTRTDLDVTLPLAEADIRIRRIGLDIDPGWLPWLGPFGCVVRFHYRDREAGH
jgi:hypothetical protein